jgi:hypothetical protein
MAAAGEDHCHVALVCGRDNFGVTNGASRLNRASRASIGCRDQTIRKREKASLATALTDLKRSRSIEMIE